MREGRLPKEENYKRLSNSKKERLEEYLESNKQTKKKSEESDWRYESWNKKLMEKEVVVNNMICHRVFIIHNNQEVKTI